MALDKFGNGAEFSGLQAQRVAACSQLEIYSACVRFPVVVEIHKQRPMLRLKVSAFFMCERIDSLVNEIDVNL